MRWHKAATVEAVIFSLGVLAQASQASAQTFDSYRCADGTHFILAFYPSDKRAFMQIDGRAVTLKKNLTLSSKRYSGSGVSVVMTATGVLIKHVRRPATACELS
jgi:membrane-bound inhibitor of C-type lysozyme